MTSDGDALFAGAVLTCARGKTPRDGGAAISALCDWLTERFDDGVMAIALADSLSGIGLTVFRRPDIDLPYRVFFVGEDSDEDLTDITNLWGFTSLDKTAPPGHGTSFYDAFIKVMSAMWRGNSP